MNKMLKKGEVVSLATGVTRPSRQEAEAAVRTLIRWAGDDPDREGLFWVAGLAGAGMVCSGELGRIAAALLTGAGGEVEADIVEALAPARLAAAVG